MVEVVQPARERRVLAAVDMASRDAGLALWVRPAERHGGARLHVGRAARERLSAILDGRGRPAPLVGLDAPLGVPEAWAERVGLPSFRALLCDPPAHLAGRFARPARTLEEVAPERPFMVPAAGVRRAAWPARLGLGDGAAVLRRCDRLAGAHPLFWCVGPRQVGRAALRAWREFLAPRWCAGTIALWPFDGPLDRLLAGDRPVVAEIYPSLVRRRFDSGRVARARVRFGEALAARLRAVAEHRRPRRDRDDAAFGLIALEEALAGRVEAPGEPAVRRLEGWILARDLCPPPVIPKSQTGKRRRSP